MSPQFFELIGTQPLYGRTFLDSEATPGQDRRVVLGYGLWVRRFGSDPSIVGKSLRLNSEPYEVVGVLRDANNRVAIPINFLDTHALTQRVACRPGSASEFLARDHDRRGAGSVIRGEIAATRQARSNDA